MGCSGVKGVIAAMPLGVTVRNAHSDDSYTHANKKPNVTSSGFKATITTSSKAAITPNGAKAE